MKDGKDELKKKKMRLDELLATRSQANCDTRHLSPADIQREEEIEELESAVKELETKLGSSSTSG